MPLTQAGQAGALVAEALPTLLLPGDSRAAGLVFDAISNANTGSGTSNTLSWSHTVTAQGSNAALFVFVCIKNTGAETVGSVTYGSASMVFVDAQNNGTNVRVELWKLMGPPTGTNTVLVTIAAAGTPRFVGLARSYTGVNQVQPLGTAAKATGSSNSGPATATAASAVGEVVINGAAKQFTEVLTPDVTQGNSATDVTSNGTGSFNVEAGSSDKPGAASVAMSWTYSAGGARNWAILAVSVKPA